MSNTNRQEIEKEGLGYDLMTAAAGAALTCYGLRKNGVGGKVAITAGAMLAASGMASILRDMLGPAKSTEIREMIEVNAPPQRVFELWSHLENLPRFISGITDVTRIGDRVWKWALESPGSSQREVEIEQVAGAPNRFLIWRSLSREIPLLAEIHLEATATGTRIMAVFSNWRQRGRIQALWRRLNRTDARSAVSNVLARFKQFVEA
ncbi:MAG: hypothetical protein DMF61_04185 [Blastocatellia bacterium AA13]|nr:MAG: hypothetical protein DMF61_04185 [Blastocatellia bacterium AA13]